MQESLKASSSSKNSHWLNIVEIVSVVGSIGGSIASVVTQQVAFASIPLSLSVTLNLLNRRQLLESMQQNHESAIAQVAQENAETQAKIEILAEQLVEVKQLNTDLGQNFKNLQDYTQNIRKEQMKISKLVSFLREIETCEQTIRIKPSYAEAYYNKGITHQSLGDKEAAICDYTDAIRISPSYTEAYYNRGIIRAELGDKKGAVEDLREAARLFFEQGDIANYQKARDLSKKLHELSSQSKTEPPEALVVEDLFS